MNNLPNLMTLGAGPYDSEVICYKPTPEEIASDLKLTFDEVSKLTGQIVRKWCDFDGEEWHPIFLSWTYTRQDDEFNVTNLTIRIDGHDITGNFRLNLAVELDEQMFIVYEKNFKN